MRTRFEQAKKRVISNSLPSWLRPADQAQLVYHSLILILLLFRFSELNAVVKWSVLQQLITLAVVPVLASGAASRYWVRRLIADWYHLVLIPITFHELAHLVPALNPFDQDSWLATIDRLLLGGSDPTLLLQRWHHPLLTEILQLCYGLYYALPVALGVALKRRRRSREFSLSLFALVSCFFLTYLGYFLVPALGPRFHLATEYSVPLQGMAVFDFLRQTLNDLEGVMRDCFPSGHTAVTLVIMHLAFLYSRRLFWLFLLPSIGLLFSTVYLRYHYVVDLIGGAAVYLVIVITAPRIYALWERRMARQRGFS